MSRFEYTRLTSEEFSEGLRDLDMKPKTFARIFGVNDENVYRWLSGKQDIPPWVHVALALLFLPGAIQEARKAAAEHIRLDRDHPERGEFPYLNIPDNREDS